VAEQIVSDLIMKFVDSKGAAIAGEARTEINLRPCAMTSGFKTDEMFEVESFTFKTGLGGEDEDEATQKMKDMHEHQTKQLDRHFQALAAASGINLPGLKGAGANGFKKFRNGEDGTLYPVDMKPVEFTRAIDKSSPALLQNCINRKVFKSASLIKRKAAGGPSAGEVFLRFDFTDVLMKSIEWDNEEPIKETCEFVCRAVTIHYLPQLPDGTLGAAKQAFWSASPSLNPVNLKA
jgi:type VI protein secretion system component Hcp